MIRPPSLQRQYDDFFSLDPAFIQPPDKPESQEHEEYVAKLNAAKETGDWSAVLLPGQVPTKFVLGQVDRNIWRALWDRFSLPHDCPQRIGQRVMENLLFRLAIRSIVGFGDFKIERKPDPNWYGWEMAQPELTQALDEISLDIVGEIGAGVARRLQGIGPK